MNTTKQNKYIIDISSFTLHILAMLFMLCDHMWATVIPGQAWMNGVGRLAFPIFAFLIVEGYFYTKDFKKYILRLLVFAIISEIPFNLMYASSWIFPFHQNVLWTFILALLCMKSVDRIKEKQKPWLAYPLMLIVTGFFFIAALLSMADYNGYGLFMVMVFYFFRGNGIWHRMGQFIGMIINWHLMKGMMIPVTLWGISFEFPHQGLAVFALLFIWCYHNRQGMHNKVIQYLFYGFYPLHMLILGLLSN